MNWSNLWSKVKHAIVPAAGAAAGAVLAAMTGGVGLGAAALAKIAGGAFVAYLIKPARPDAPAKE